MHTKVCIIDPKFGEFLQSPMGHLGGQGHPMRGRKTCDDKRRLGIAEFIKRATKKHGSLYDYSKVVYTSVDSPVCIVDPKYGEFWQTPWNHLKSHGCPERTKRQEWMINEDHTIPLSIIMGLRDDNPSWMYDRPLFKFLNTDINLIKIPARSNREKSDKVIINGEEISARTIRNYYPIISFLIETVLGVDPEQVIEEDKVFMRSYLGA
jgi:hypothetical protein